MQEQKAEYEAKLENTLELKRDSLDALEKLHDTLLVNIRATTQTKISPPKNSSQERTLSPHQSPKSGVNRKILISSAEEVKKTVPRKRDIPVPDAKSPTSQQQDSMDDMLFESVFADDLYESQTSNSVQGITASKNKEKRNSKTKQTRWSRGTDKGKGIVSKKTTLSDKAQKKRRNEETDSEPKNSQQRKEPTVAATGTISRSQKSVRGRTKTARTTASRNSKKVSSANKESNIGTRAKDSKRLSAVATNVASSKTDRSSKKPRVLQPKKRSESSTRITNKNVSTPSGKKETDDELSIFDF